MISIRSDCIKMKCCPHNLLHPTLPNTALQKFVLYLDATSLRTKVAFLDKLFVLPKVDVSPLDSTLTCALFDAVVALWVLCPIFHGLMN